MNCEWVRQNISACIDGELEKSLAAGMKEHIESCGACKSAYVEMKDAWAALDLWEDEDPPTQLSASVLRRIRDERRRRRSRILLPAAAVLLVALSIVLLYRAEDKGTKDMFIVQSGNNVSLTEKDLMDVEQEEIIANLHILQEKDFYDSLDTLEKIDYLPLLYDEGMETDQRSQLEAAVV